MRVKIEVIRETDADTDRQNVSIETQMKRNDSFNIMSAQDVIEGETATFTLAPGGRLVINSSRAIEEPVYDRDQGAAVYASQQRQGREGADRTDPDHLVKLKEQELKQAKENAANIKEQNQRQMDAEAAARRTPMQGGQPLNQRGAVAPSVQGQAGVQRTGDSAVKTTTTPNTTPASGGAPQGGNTEKK